MDLKTDKEFKSLLRPLTETEYAALERSMIKMGGARDAVVGALRRLDDVPGGVAGGVVNGNPHRLVARAADGVRGRNECPTIQNR